MGGETKSTTYFAVILLTLCLWDIGFFGLVLYQGVQLNQVQNEVMSLKTQNYELKKELEASESRCKRMTDTCIDILANKRWE